MDKDSRIYVAGHTGLVGSALVRALEKRGHQLLLRTRAELDLTDSVAVTRFFSQHRPEYVFLVAARVGGIQANRSQPADFIRDNLQIQTNVIEAARLHGCRKLLFPGSSCIYPRDATQPMTEDALLSGPPEPTSQWYAIAKLAGLKMVQACRRQYGMSGICPMPASLYGPGDHFDPETSHVLPALIRKFDQAVTENHDHVTIWGSGTPRREFLHVDDFAEACLFLMDHYDDEAIINVGSGWDVPIGELATLIAETVGYKGAIRLDRSKPDGVPRKLLDVSRMTALGWKPRISLSDGLRQTWQWYREVWLPRQH